MRQGFAESLLVLDEPTFGNRQEGLRYLADAALHHGVDYLAYLAIDVPKFNRRMSYAISNYSQQWIQRYIDRQYGMIDPVVDQCLKTNLPIDWASIRLDCRRDKEFFGESREFGVKENGISVPISGINGEKAMFTVNSSLKGSEWKRFYRKNRSHIMLCGYYFHLKVMEIEGIYSTNEPNHLSPRQKECLQWAADGKTASEISDILSVGETTVRFHLNEAKRTLNCYNIPSAVAKAIRSNLIL